MENKIKKLRLDIPPAMLPKLQAKAKRLSRGYKMPVTVEQVILAAVARSLKGIPNQLK